MPTSNFKDTIIASFDNALRTLTQSDKTNHKIPYPAENIPETSLTQEEKKMVAGLMRVNHAGEVCAQALYQGQASTAQLTHIRAQMQEAADEEVTHLAWCEKRLYELDSQTSILNPIWYHCSFLIGALAGLVGDKYSLGFVAETEHQVTKHLKEHIEKLPIQDEKSKAILLQMKEDEEKHELNAMDAGAMELPSAIKYIMSIVAKGMTKTSFHI